MATVHSCDGCGKAVPSRNMLYQLRSMPAEKGAWGVEPISEGWEICSECMGAVRQTIADRAPKARALGGEDESQQHVPVR